NLLTWPLMEILSNFIFWLAEILPLLWEPILYYRYAIKDGLVIPRLGRRVVGANLISFVIGIVMWIGVLHWKEHEDRERWRRMEAAPPARTQLWSPTPAASPTPTPVSHPAR